MVRYTKRVHPDNPNEFYRDGEFITYTLPQNIIDLHSIAKYYTATVDSVEIYDDNSLLKRFLPSNSSSIIDTLEIKRDGEIVQTIPEYALLHQMYMDMQDDNTNNSDGAKTSTVSYNDFDNNNFEVKNDDFFNTTDVKSYDYCISKWLGFLNGSRYLDCRGKLVQITIKLSPKWITYRGLKINGTSLVNTIYDTDYHYHLSKCFLNMTVVHNENVDLNNEINFEDYTHFKSMKNTKSKNTTVRGRTNKNVKYILSTFTDVNRNTDTGLQLQHYNLNTAKFDNRIVASNANSTTFNTNNNNGIPTSKNFSDSLCKFLNKPNQLNNSIYFKRSGIDVKTNQYRVNGVEISPPYTALESFNNIKSTFNTQLSKVGNLASFINDFFMNVQEYNNTDNSISDVEWVVFGENKDVGGEAHLFLIHDSSVQF